MISNLGGWKQKTIFKFNKNKKDSDSSVAALCASLHSLSAFNTIYLVGPLVDAQHHLHIPCCSVNMDMEVVPTYFFPNFQSYSSFGDQREHFSNCDQGLCSLESVSADWRTKQNPPLESWDFPQSMVLDGLATRRKRKGQDLHSEKPDDMESCQEKADEFTQLECERKKQQKVAEVEVKQPSSYLMRRNVRLRFGLNERSYQGRVICKEPFGTMVELVENALNEQNEEVPMGKRYWCKWDGFVNSLSTPVLEIMYPC